jgi:hypothetical protein
VRTITVEHDLALSVVASYRTGRAAHAYLAALDPFVLDARRGACVIVCKVASACDKICHARRRRNHAMPALENAPGMPRMQFWKPDGT